MFAPSLVGFFVIAAGVAVLLGWILSPLHQVGTLTHLVLLALLLGGLAAGMIRARWDRLSLRRSLARLGRRSRQPLPLLFFLAVLLSLAGGLIYPPDNGDALSYRIPRLLAWWANHGWYWIPSADQRMNFSGTVQEWLFLPLVTATHSDRLLPLVNVIAFGLLPFPLFASFTRLGVRPRVAWWWMWLLPLGMGIVLQAASTTNDLLGAFFAVAAIDAALRYRLTRVPGLLYQSLLAMALCTGVKLSNLPLVLPWLVALGPAAQAGRRDVRRIAAVALVALAVSIVPTLALNRAHTGSAWGDPANRTGLKLSNPAAGIVGNLALITINNLDPPVLPFAGRVEARLNSLAAVRPGSWLRRHFPEFRIHLKEVPRDEQSGLGLLLILLWAWTLARGTAAAPSLARRDAVPFFASLGVAVLAFMSSIGSDYAARLFLPYSLWIVCFGLSLRDASSLVRTRAWRLAAAASAAASLVVLILAPTRPLIPVRMVLRAASRYVPAGLTERVTIALSHHDQLSDAFVQVRSALDTRDRVLGFVGSGNDLETSLWLPFGARRVIHVLPGVTAAQLDTMGIRQVVASSITLDSVAASSGPQFTWVSRSTLLGTFAHQEPHTDDVFLLLHVEPLGAQSPPPVEGAAPPTAAVHLGP